MKRTVDQVAFYAFAAGFFAVLAVWMHHNQAWGWLAFDIVLAVANAACVAIIRREAAA